MIERNVKLTTSEVQSDFQKNLDIENNVAKIDAHGVCYRELNTLLRSLDGNGIEKIEIRGVYGQRYIGTDLGSRLTIDVFGTPGNDLGAFMHDVKIVVHGNVQDGCGNTMDTGEIVVHGRAGDLVGHSMRGGKIFIRDDAGYRVGIHMKAYQDKRPLIVIGGTAQDFLGEYMAGGILVVLGLHTNGEINHNARFVGTGMHGGIIYVRGNVNHFGEEVEVVKLDESDYLLLGRVINEFYSHFNVEPEEIVNSQFTKLVPRSSRPYGKLYAY